VLAISVAAWARRRAALPIAVAAWARPGAALAISTWLLAAAPVSALPPVAFVPRQSDGLLPARAQATSLDVVMRRAGAYLAEFQRQLSGIVAEETYVQEVRGRDLPARSVRVRRLKSDLLLVRPAGADRHVEYRDVFEVDGEPVRDRQERLTRLLRDPSRSASAQIAAIIGESARHNIGGIVRNVNTPLLPLTFLGPEYQRRFEFTRAARGRAGPEGLAAPADGGAVFRVSTEMWTIEFRERRRPTVIRTPSGRDLPARGRFWIDPATGAVLMSEMRLADDVAVTITVSYQSEPLMGFLVPVEMRESYVSARERIEGRAVYGRFRPITSTEP
jgi:hypothetical protein